MTGPRVPVITIDGPAASGKGAAARGVAERAGFALLDSGAHYRAAALLSLRLGLPAGDAGALADRIRGTSDAEWEGLLADPGLRTPKVSGRASEVAQAPPVRAAILPRLRAARRPPGLVADGRDMGSIVFPDADLKVYLCADPEVRARRRALESGAEGDNDRIAAVLAELAGRDRRDSTRAAAPMTRPEGARVLDNSALGIGETVDLICAWFGEIAAGGAHPGNRASSKGQL